MPDVRMPNGTVIKNVPAGITKAQLNAKLTKNGFNLAELTTPKQAPSAIENIPLVGGLIAPIADIPLSGIEGLSGTVKSITDVFGADNFASDAADYISKSAAALRSAGSREDAEIARKIQQDAEGKGVWEQVKAAARAFTYSPLESTASVAGSAVPFLAAGVATGGTGVIPAVAMAGLGAASGAGTIKGSVYDAVHDEFVKNGASEADAAAAAEKAQEYGGKNTDQIALGTIIGALASSTGFPAQIARTIGKNTAKKVIAEVAEREAVEAVKVGTRKSALGAAAKGAVVEAVPEAVQGGQERLSQNLALQREGFDVDTWKGVAGQAAAEGIASLVLGGYGGASEARAENRTAITKEISEELDALPADADEQTISEAEARFVKRGFPLETAKQIVEKLRSSKAAIAEQAANLEKARAEKMAQYDAEAAAEEGTGSNFNEPPPVDKEEEAAMQRMREAEAAGETLAEESPFIFDGKDYGSYRALEAERQSTLQYQAKRQELLGDNTKLEAYAADKGISAGEMQTLLTDNYKNGQDIITRLTKKLVTPEMQTIAQAEKQRAGKIKFAEQAAPQRGVEGGTITPAVPVFHGTNNAFDTFNFDQKRGGITFTTDPKAADFYAKDRAKELGGEGRVVESRLNIKNPLYVEETNDYVDAVEYAKANGYDAVIGPAHLGPNPPLNVTVWDKNVLADKPSQAPSAAPARSTAPTITPAFAATTLQDEDAVRAFADQYGIDEAEAVGRLNAAAKSPTGIKYSRGRPSRTNADEGLFDALPKQEENRLDKFEEIQQRKLEQGAIAPEDREAENQARADEFDRLQQERAAKDEQYTTDFVNNIQEAIRSANPANEAYSVQVDKTSPKPYRVVGPDGELFAAADNLQDFEEQAMGLLPYVAPPTPIQDTDSANPTVATSMVQELTRDIDAARERGEIDNNQRTQLIRQLERPDAYDKYGRPQDNIAKAEEEARAAMSKFRNTTGTEAKAAEAELAVANEKLTKLVNNRMLNPIRSKLRSMTEMRKDEQLGAKIRIKDALKALAKRMVIVIHGGSDFDALDRKKFGTGEPGNFRALGNGLYGFVVDRTNSDEVAAAVNYARVYSEKYGRGTKAIHAFQLDMSDIETRFKGPIRPSLAGPKTTAKAEMDAAWKEFGDAPLGSDGWRKFKAAREKYEDSVGLTVERLPIGLTEVAVNELGSLERIGKVGLNDGDDKLVSAIQDALLEGKQQEVAARKELREAKIDLAESRVSKYRKGEAEPGGAPKIVPITNLQALVDAITAQWKSPNPVQVVGSILDIKDRKLRNAIMKDDALDAKGLVAPDGTIYLVADNLLSLEDGKAVLFHEALGHVGLEKLFRENLDSALIAMYKSNPKVRADTDKWRSENEGAYADDVNPLARAVEEVLAERSERGQLEVNLFQKIAAIIRNFARRMGINIKISDGDVAAILSMAHDKVVRGDAESAVVKGLRYINVWHGSPHNFDRFTTDKIGSGEGAQVYGWGLYFTDTKQIAEKQYRDRLSGGPRVSVTIDGENVTVPVGYAYTLALELGFPAKGKNKFPAQYPVTIAIRELVENGGDLEAAIAFMNDQYSHWPKQVMNDVEAKLREINPSIVTSPGKLYNVELAPKEEDFLLWDKPITEQSDKVQAILAEAGFKPMSRTDKAFAVLDYVIGYDDMKGEWYGSSIYKAIVENIGSPKAASLALLDAGIRGNKYLDGNSRGLNLDKPGYNYVIFADDDVDMVAKYSRPKATPEEKKKVENAAAGLSAGARRVNDTMSTYGLVDGIEEAADSAPTLRNALIYAKDTASPIRQLALKSMPSSGITGWLERKAPAVYEAAEVLVDTVRKMNGMRVSLKAAGDNLIRDMEDFVREYGTEALARAQFTNRINEVDFLAFKTVDEALAKHRAIKAIEDELLSNSNNKAETRKLIDEIKEQALNPTDNTTALKNKVKLSTPILARMNSLTKVAIANDKVLLKVKQLAVMTQRIRDSYAAKEELAKQKGGLKLYKDEREYHKDMFEARQALLDERIARGQGEEAMVRIRDIRAQMMRELQSPNERQKSGDIFWDLDADLFDKEYFPALRDGQYWLRVEEDLSKGREEEFHVFESARELEQARRAVAKRLGENPEDGNIFKTGNDIGELQDTLRETDDLMQRIFDVVTKARNEYKNSGQVDMQDLVDSVYQTWLMTTPERSARRHFMHAKLIAGFSPNTLGNLQRSVSANANELTKLAYAGQVRIDVKGIKDVIGDKQRPVSEQAMLGDFARELEKRAEQEINPNAHNAIINFINRSSFYYFLTSARTALTNFANIPMRVIPRFWREYGYVEGTAMWVKYMKMWDSLGRVKIERTNMRFGDYLDAIMPTVNGSNFVKNNADLQWAMKAGTERGILMTTADTMIHNERGATYKSRSNLTGKAQDLAGNVGKVMGFLFTGTETISRQATFYMAFELEMNKQKKENPTKPLEMRREAALRKAMQIADDTIGDFSNWERPSIAKGELTRGFFLFKMHPILQTKFITGAFRDIIGAPLRGVARQATGKGKLNKEDTAYMAGALVEFSGVMMMAGLLGGVGALPFYTMMAHALAEGFDDEDDDDVRKLMGMDTRTAYDADIMFRRWLMEKMGTADNKDVDFADIFIGGVPGALTNTEISSAVSLDLVNLWYREPIAGDNLESSMIATAIQNIAGMSMATQFIRGGEALYEGNIADGLKKTLPAFFRSWVTAYANETEGVKNRKGDTIIPKEDITGGDFFRSALGARSNKLARWQDYYITASKNEKRIKAEKQDILDDLETKIRSGDIASKSALKEFIKDEVVPFNRTYPDEDFVITEDTIARSMKGRSVRSARNVQGMQLSKKTAERRLRAAQPFRP